MDGDWARLVGPVLRETGFLVTTEIAYAAHLASVPVIEMPVRLREPNHGTRVRMRDISNMFLGLFSLRRRRGELRTAACGGEPAYTPRQ
jgi:dolichyl-phosphate beta-glucosyltransferase